MSSNGHTSTPRIRRDSPRVSAPPMTSGVSGRRVVVGICLVVLTLWGGLTLAMNSWRRAYEANSAYGRTEIAPLVDPLAQLVPPDVDPTRWAAAVADTHMMLRALTASSLLEKDGLIALRVDLVERLRDAEPETARPILIKLWDDLEKKAGPVMNASSPPPSSSRHASRVERPERPKLLINPASI